MIPKLVARVPQRIGLASVGAALMVVGMPNVGKSTLINSLRHVNTRRGKVAKTGAKPGVTRHIAPIEVCAKPKAYLLDSPGIMMPSNVNPELGLRLAVAGMIKDSIVGEESSAEALFCLLRNQNDKTWSQKLLFRKGTSPDTFEDCLLGVQNLLNRRNNGGDAIQLEDTRAELSRHFLACYRSGQLGRYTLDPFPPVDFAGITVAETVVAE
mmetsp:Transcript_7378/g.19134  ORF Transcript_7378/g.19134 Transcript_7378/m.19134 type:complete len:211 (+) Transcript_7378:525-1157(+)